MSSDPFVTRAQERLRVLANRRREILEGFERQQAEIRSIDEEAIELGHAFDTYRRVMGLDLEADAIRPRPPRTATKALPRGAYAELSYQALKDLGGEATLGQIVAHLQAERLIPQERHAYFSTRSALNRQPDLIVKTDKGFRLIEFKQMKME